MSLEAAFAEGRFVITSEVGPPKGTDTAAMLETAAMLSPHVDALNVTDNQAAVMRLCTLAACAHLKAAGHEVVYQATCRDRNRLALQSDLLGAASFGITNVLALTGDHVRVGDHPQAKAVFDLESVQLLRAIQTLNSGTDLAGKELHGTPEFYAGAVVTPDSVPLAPQLAKFEKKVAAGARYFQTQAVYDIASFERFMTHARRFDVKVLAGIVVLRSARMASFMNANIPGITVPEAIVAELTASEDAAATGVEVAARFIRGAREMCDGIHIMAIGAEHLAPRVIEAAGLSREVPE